MAGQFVSVENEIAILQGLQGVSQQQLATLRDDLESRSTPAFGPVGGANVGSGASELYARGTTAFSQGGYGAAELAFQEIVEMHQGDPLVPDARYYLALIHAEEGEHEAAITAFREVQESYPSSPRAPEALYRMGLLYLELGNRTEAVNSFTRVTENYAGSDVAALARAELQRLR
jgi:tol-pal system protein YbgF